MLRFAIFLAEVAISAKGGFSKPETERLANKAAGLLDELASEVGEAGIGDEALALLAEVARSVADQEVTREEAAALVRKLSDLQDAIADEIEEEPETEPEPPRIPIKPGTPEFQALPPKLRRRILAGVEVLSRG